MRKTSSLAVNLSRCTCTGLAIGKDAPLVAFTRRLTFVRWAHITSIPSSKDICYLQALGRTNLSQHLLQYSR